MNIAKLRRHTLLARVSKEAEFMASPLRKYIDARIQKAADEGEGEISLDFDHIKRCVLGVCDNYPTIDVVIRHYRNEGFNARAFHDMNDISMDGRFRIYDRLCISWM